MCDKFAVVVIFGVVVRIVVVVDVVPQPQCGGSLSGYDMQRENLQQPRVFSDLSVRWETTLHLQGRRDSN